MGLPLERERGAKTQHGDREARLVWAIVVISVGEFDVVGCCDFSCGWGGDVLLCFLIVAARA